MTREQHPPAPLPISFPAISAIPACSWWEGSVLSPSNALLDQRMESGEGAETMTPVGVSSAGNERELGQGSMRDGAEMWLLPWLGVGAETPCSHPCAGGGDRKNLVEWSQWAVFSLPEPMASPFNSCRG